MLAVSFLAAGACADGDVAAPPTPPAGPERISLSPNEVSLIVGEFQRIFATVTNAAGQVVASPEMTWTSSDTSVAAVDQSGIVFARASGSATITARYRSVQASKGVSVRPGRLRLTLSPNEAVLAPGTTVTATAELLDVFGQPITERVPPIEWSVDRADLFALQPVAAAGSSRVQLTAKAWGMGMLHARAAGLVALASLLVAPPIVDDELKVEEFRLQGFDDNSGALTDITPIIALSHPSSTLDIVRFDLLIPGVPAVPSMCGGLRLDPGAPRYLFGYVSYDFELSLQPNLPGLPTSDAIALVTYRAANGELRGRLARGPVTVSSVFPSLPIRSQSSWTACG